MKTILFAACFCLLVALARGQTATTQTVDVSNASVAFSGEAVGTFIGEPTVKSANTTANTTVVGATAAVAEVSPVTTVVEATPVTTVVVASPVVAVVATTTPVKTTTVVAAAPVTATAQKVVAVSATSSAASLQSFLSFLF